MKLITFNVQNKCYLNVDSVFDAENIVAAASQADHVTQVTFCQIFLITSKY